MSSCTSILIQCNRPALWSFIYLQIVCFLASLSKSLQLTCHPIICEFSNCALSYISFHIHCNWLVLRSFVNFQIVRLLAPNSTFIAIDLPFYHFLILKLCIVLYLFPHWMQSTWHPIICEFSNCASSCISFHIHCNQLAILPFLIVKLCVFLHLYPHSLQSTCPVIIYVSSNCAFSCMSFKIIAIDSSSKNLWIFKLCIVLHLFPHSLQLNCPPIIFEFKRVLTRPKFSLRQSRKLYFQD